ncbi:MAG: OmpA family protein [Myxococcales bacterium]|nr:OmpA family protein [Polyangiaceae bacterium]MDW8248921.1 OmpA family protein [Myxococcales bacterium]
MKTSTLSLCAVLSLGAAACGRTELEWEQKVREVEALSNRVARQNLERAKLEEDMARMQEDNTTLKAELATRTMSQSTEAACTDRLRNEHTVLEQSKARADLLRTRLEPLVGEGVTVSLRKGQLTIGIPASLLFEGKGASLTPKGRKTLRTVAEAIRADERLLARFFLITVHEVPGKNEEGAIARTRARAEAIRELLVGREGGLMPTRWASAGRGVVDPIFGDDQPEMAERNRRVELVMLPEPDELLTSAPRSQP